MSAEVIRPVVDWTDSRSPKVGYRLTFVRKNGERSGTYVIERRELDHRGGECWVQVDKIRDGGDGATYLLLLDVLEQKLGGFLGKTTT